MASSEGAGRVSQTMSKGRKLRAGSQIPVNPNVTKWGVAASWDPSPEPIDVDLQGVIVNSNGDIIDAVYYNNMHALNSVRHSGDEKTGDRKGYDEYIWVMMHELPSAVQLIVFIAAAYNKGRLRDVKNGQFHVMEEVYDNELACWDMDNGAGEVDVVAALVKDDYGSWNLHVIEEPAKSGKHFMDILEPTIGDQVRRYIPAAPKRIKCAFSMEKGSGAKSPADEELPDQAPVDKELPDAREANPVPGKETKGSSAEMEARDTQRKEIKGVFAPDESDVVRIDPAFLQAQATSLMSHATISLDAPDASPVTYLPPAEPLPAGWHMKGIDKKGLAYYMYRDDMDSATYTKPCQVRPSHCGCGRPVAEHFEHCCRTCKRSGGTSHGPQCNASFFSLDDRVKVRDDQAEDWQFGSVTTLSPLQVRVDWTWWPKGWAEVMPLEEGPTVGQLISI